MISVQEALEIINQHIPKRKQQFLPLKKALGYTTSSDIYSRYNLPNFVQSSMDGYAIRFEDKNKTLKVSGEIPAGCTQRFHLENGNAYRIFTGAPLPDGADTVVMQEKVRIIDHQYIVIEDHELEKGTNVRPIGSDARPGAVAIRSGSHLSAAAIGYLAGMGCTEVQVYAPPSVSLIMTGNELVEPGQTLDFGQVFESNSFQLESVLRQCGISEINTFRVKDDPEALKETINSAISETDIVILVGGVSVGDYDYVIEAAEKCGIKQQFHKIRQKPGKPLYFGTKEEKLIFGLPGNPSSALTCFYLYIVPVLATLLKRKDITEKKIAVTTSAYSKKTGLTHFLKATYSNETVTPLYAQESYRLQSFAEANCLMIIDEDTEGCEKGESVEILLLS